MNRKRFIIRTGIVLIFILYVLVTSVWAAPPTPTPAAGQTIPIPAIGLDIKAADNPKDVATSLQILFVLTILSLAPSILIMMSAFTRIIIVLSFTRSALGTQQMPPNQVLIGLALFLTFFVMTPVIKEVNEQAYQPYVKGEITQKVALDKAMEPIRNFMYKHTRTKDMALFLNLSQVNQSMKITEIPTSALIPAFIISELKTAFMIGFFLYIPFLIIDMVVASALMSMGMMMLPPVMISMPFKLLLFVMVDGWNLIIRSLIMGFK